jgi:hypothetical protein
MLTIIKDLNYPVLMEMYMSSLRNLDDNLYHVSVNEPKVHPLIRKSFVFVPSAGMRLAPEILVLEFFREVFFDTHYGSPGGKNLHPNEQAEDKTYIYTSGERAVLYALRGRRRKSRNAKSDWFFAPAYPALARNGWLGKNRERVIVNFLLGGPIAQYLWGGGETEVKKHEQKSLVETLICTLIGHNSFLGEDPHGKDILSIALRETTFKIDRAVAEENIFSKTVAETEDRKRVMKIFYDELSERIFKDLLALCELEEKMPRMQWLQVFMTFLRFSMPMWLLAQMRITSLLHEYLIAVLDQKVHINSIQIEKEIGSRNRGLLHPSITPTREIFEKTELYMKKRIELNILLYLLEYTRTNMISNKRLKIQGAGSNVITIEQLLQVAQEATNDMKSSKWFQEESVKEKFQDFLTRKAERHVAWRDPLKKGQGKNIDEFFRVLYRDNIGDEIGGYLLLPKGRGRTRGFRVFPGQLLLKTIAFLAAHDKHTNSTTRGGGILVIEDVENHFQQYGIDFSYAADARPLLMQELQAMGLLTGSPDAGSSVAVICPY